MLLAVSGNYRKRADQLLLDRKIKINVTINQFSPNLHESLFHKLNPAETFSSRLQVDIFVGFDRLGSQLLGRF